MIKTPQRKSDLENAIRGYWESPDTISIIDKNLHKLEIDTASKYIRRSDSVADIGCGNGIATVEYAKKARRCVGFERSSYLRKKAIKNARKSGLKNITIQEGDILQMKSLPKKFDVVITQRSLINMASWKEQKDAILNIYNMLKKGGLYIAIENTNDSFKALNDMRVEVGLKPIPQHWHNLFFDYKKLMSFLRGKFKVVAVSDFGLYYFLTRLYVQMFASFTGYGKKAKKDAIFEYSDKAARIVHEKFCNRIKIGPNRTTGPIQAFILRKG